MSESTTTRKPGTVYTEYDQNLISARMDLCLIRLVKTYGDDIRGFDGNMQDTAVDRSLDYMEGYIQAFESHLDYLQSYEHISQRYEKLTGSIPVQPISRDAGSPLRVVDDGA